jgi:hypothetical protein
MRTVLLALVLLPLSAHAATWREARSAAKAAVAGGTGALPVSRDARGLTYRVTVPTARGSRSYDFLLLSNGDLSLRPVKVFDVSRRGSVVDHGPAGGVKISTHGRLVGADAGKITYALSLAPMGQRLPLGQVSYDPATGRLKAQGQASATGPKGLSPGLRLYQLVSHYRTHGGVPNEVF